jgi:hypothetical protein
MIPDEVHIPPTENTPEFHMHPSGKIKIKGRGLIFNNTDVPKEITRWIDAYIISPAEITTVIIAFEYLNSYSTAILVSMLRKLLQIDTESNKIHFHWYFESGDDDILERGEYIASTYNIPIDFIMIDNINEV